MTEAEMALREAMQRITELERKLRALETKVGLTQQIALGVQPPGNA